MERLTGLDASFLYLETDTQHLHVCALLILDPADQPYSFDNLRAELGRRLPLIPHLRRRVHEVPFNLDHPIWVDDADFDIDNHLRRVELPAPVGMDDLAGLLGEIASTPMDRNRPLWEMSVVEGLDDGKVAVLCKYHHSAVDGITGTNMMMHLCDLEPGLTRPEPEPWTPEPVPSDLELAARAAVRQPPPAGMRGMVAKTQGVVGGLAQRRRNSQSGIG
ncbi:wax ester/triacylglycerol synthase domain-containing protein, partial [Nocardia neocaledoniensis]|uniref:wax ester/triacylglycerol synthase domain-containing protein n=1 Tax=Nocardia neocaledoniensis TaxID=236511 RepID=UPI002454FBFC